MKTTVKSSKNYIRDKAITTENWNLVNAEKITTTVIMMIYNRQVVFYRMNEIE